MQHSVKSAVSRRAANALVITGLLASLTATIHTSPVSAAATHACAANESFDPSLATTSEGATIARLYCAAFGRAPDLEGYAFWQARYAEWWSLEGIAGYFADSPEFLDTFGATSNTEFLDALYQHVFRRAPDAEGLAYWLGRLDTDMTRAGVLLWFADSPEMQAQLPLATGLPSAARVYGELVDNPRSNDPDARIVVIPLSTPEEPPPLVNVHGFQVHSLLADEFAAMWSAAQADGVILVSNGGYRSTEGQVAARIRNGCPDIWVSEADTCRTPTSRPGDSNHNHARAVDFILSSGDYAWLVANAHRFGFYAYYSQQLPVWEHNATKPSGIATTSIERWHWDTTGALAAITGAMQLPSHWPQWFAGNFPGDT